MSIDLEVEQLDEESAVDADSGFIFYFLENTEYISYRQEYSRALQNGVELR